MIPPSGQVFYTPLPNNEGIVTHIGHEVTEVQVGDRIKVQKGKGSKLEFKESDGKDLSSVLVSHIYFVYVR